jgi:predicted acetyltransferase
MGPVGPRQLHVLDHLVQLYRHDLSEGRGYELRPSGTFASPYLGSYLDRPDREACLVWSGDQLAGFVLTRRLDDGTWRVDELFVARTLRRQGVARVAFGLTFDRHPGRWACFVDELNDASLGACQKAVVDRTGAEPTAVEGATNGPGFTGTAIRFTVPADRARF